MCTHDTVQGEKTTENNVRKTLEAVRREGRRKEKHAELMSPSTPGWPHTHPKVPRNVTGQNEVTKIECSLVHAMHVLSLTVPHPRSLISFYFSFTRVDVLPA